MNLRRYNEILFAVVVTVAAIVGIVHVWRFGLPGGSQDAGRADVVPGAPEASPKNAAPASGGRSLALCLPSFAPGTDWQYYPVAAVGVAPGAIGAGTPWTTNLSEACHLPEGSSQGVFDVVIRNSSTNEQRLLLGHPGQILDMTLPDPACSSGSGSVPCNTIFWLVRDHDSNQDGVVDGRDETILYVSDLAARYLSRVSPPDASVLDWIWNSRSGEVLLQVQLASGGTKVVNARLQPAAPGSEVVVPRVMDQLQRTVNPGSAPAPDASGQPLLLTPATPNSSGPPAVSGGSSSGS
jgi:hypothetical protein